MEISKINDDKIEGIREFLKTHIIKEDNTISDIVETDKSNE